MIKKLAEVEIGALIKKHYPAALNIRELHGGLVSQTYSFQEGENRLIFQAGNSLEAYEKEKWIDKNIHTILPVRKVLEVHVTENELVYSFSKFIEGNKLFDLNSQELLDIVPAVIKTLEALEKVDVTESEGYGRFDKTGYATYPSWLDFIKAVYNENIYNWSALENNGLDSEVVRNAIQELKVHISSVTLKKKNMVHGDLGSFNLLAKDDQITGIIDWSLALYGDHLYDKANILFWNEDKLQPLVQQITQRYIASPESKERIYCYMLRIGLEEIYNTVILKEVGYDIEWGANRLQRIMDNDLKN
ncbi:aminoglycoside phosphotransferase family protein [Paenibacillus sepulcri]|uniref:aminoglycoside phosphotransferase family protein n=1 Tax=Paenibacillus sepulcri TaxID=359917 RepID=UPI0035EFFEFA